MGSNLRVAPARLEDSMKVRLQRLYPKSKLVAGGEALLVPVPEDVTILEWVSQLLVAMFPQPAVAASGAPTAS
jgi:transcription-repair coupling factor (superfamily II helicase)